MSPCSPVTLSVRSSPNSESVVQGQWEQRSPLFSRCSAMPGARLTETLVCCSPDTTVGLLSLSAGLSRAERSALHLVGPQCILVELKWVLHRWSLDPCPWGWAHHKGLSMEPLTALNQSLAVLRHLQH